MKTKRQKAIILILLGMILVAVGMLFSVLYFSVLESIDKSENLRGVSGLSGSSVSQAIYPESADEYDKRISAILTAARAEENSFFIDDFPDSEFTHWSHMPLSYNSYGCNTSPDTNRKIRNALFAISKETGNAVRFTETHDMKNADIVFRCNFEGEKNLDGRKVIAEAVPYVYSERRDIYSGGEIIIYERSPCSAENPVVIIHEVLHLFGLEHTSDDKRNYNDVMNPSLENCDARISERDINTLKEIYGNQNKQKV